MRENYLNSNAPITGHETRTGIIIDHIIPNKFGLVVALLPLGAYRSIPVTEIDHHLTVGRAFNPN